MTRLGVRPGALGIKRGGWPYWCPPSGELELNLASQQAVGLVAGWLPLASVGTKGLRDLSGHGNDGVLNGAVAYVTSQFGHALDFSGGEVIVPYSSYLAGTGAFTVTAWVWDDDYTQNGALIARWDAVDANKAFYFAIIADRIRLGIQESAILRYQESAAGSVIDGQWYHVAGRFMPNTNLDVFIDGVLANNLSPTIPAAVQATTVDLWLGDREDAALPFDGYMAEARFYNCGVSNSGIRQMADPSTRWELWRPKLRRWAGYTAEGPTNYPVSLTLGRQAALADSGQSAGLAAATLARQAGIADSGAAAAGAALSLEIIKAVVQAAVAAAVGDTSLTHLRGISEDATAAAAATMATAIYEAIGLSTGLTASLTLARFAASSLAAVAAAEANASLGEALGIAFSGQAAAGGAVDLGKVLAVTASALAAAAAMIAVARSLGASFVGAEAEVAAAIALTLQSRELSLTLQERSLALTLVARALAD